MTHVWSVVNVAAMIVMAFAAAYFFIAVGFGLREIRIRRVPIGFQSGLAYGAPFDPLPGAVRPEGYTVYFLVACLNEAAVIASTVSSLVDPDGGSSIVVVDDGSDDDTGALAVAAGQGQATVVRRELPEARRGKGAALNAGFSHIVEDAARRGLDPTDVVVVVMDADGRLSDGAMGEVLPLFDDPRVGGVQLAVRIRNRSTNVLLRFQDHQFWTQSALTQFGRIATQTVSLGGNGQFTRLSALLEVGDQPWSAALTEDLDLTVSIATRGWLTTSSPRASVDQQGVESLRGLLRQRTRWYQGHMMAGTRIPEVLRSRQISNAGAIELVLYLAVPWIFDLPWSVLYHLVLIEIGIAAAHTSWGDFGSAGLLGFFAVWYILGFWPALVTAHLARRRDPALTRARAYAMGHAFVLTNYLSYVCCWRAIFRMMRGRRGWEKTDRVAEIPVPAGGHR